MADRAEDYVNSIKPFYQDCGSTVFSRKQMIECYHQAEKDIGKSLVRFFRDNITFDAHDGLIVDIPTFFDLIYECSKAIGIDLMPIYKNR